MANFSQNKVMLVITCLAQPVNTKIYVHAGQQDNVLLKHHLTAPTVSLSNLDNRDRHGLSIGNKIGTE